MLAALGKSDERPSTPRAPRWRPPALEVKRLASIETEMPPARLGRERQRRSCFDALHGELKGYKDNFLFDALQRPVHTATSSRCSTTSRPVHVQMAKRLAESAANNDGADNEGHRFPARARRQRRKPGRTT